MLRPYLGVLILSILLAAVSVVLTLYAPVLIGDAVDLVIGPGQVSFSPSPHCWCSWPLWPALRPWYSG